MCMCLGPTDNECVRPKNTPIGDPDLEFQYKKAVCICGDAIKRDIINNL